MKFVDGNPVFELYDFGYTDDLARIIGTPNFVTVNNSGIRTQGGGTGSLITLNEVARPASGHTNTFDGILLVGTVSSIQVTANLTRVNFTTDSVGWAVGEKGTLLRSLAQWLAATHTFYFMPAARFASAASAGATPPSTPTSTGRPWAKCCAAPANACTWLPDRWRRKLPTA